MDKVALDSVALLKYRLRRIEFLLTGTDESQRLLHEVASQGQDQSLPARLGRLEDDLARLASRSTVVNELLSLYASQPGLFQPINPDEVPTTLSPQEVLAVVNSSATSFPTTASRLTSIKDLPVPSAESLAALIALQPRLTGLELLQESQGRELAELRLRSALAIRRWHELGVLGASECWTEWEGRMTGIEKMVRRGEGVRARELKADDVYQT